MPLAKPRRIETTDQATAGLTLPLRTKLWLVFGGFAALFILAFGLAVWLLVLLISQSDLTLNRQVRLDRIHQIQLAFAGEQAAIGRLLVANPAGERSESAVNDFEFTLYQITFDNNLVLLKRDPARAEIATVLLDLEQRHANLTANFLQMLEEMRSGDLSRATRQWADNSLLLQDLTARLTVFAEEQTQLSEAAQAELNRQQTASLIGLGLICGIGGLLLFTLIWLANRYVIGPMGRLNIKLGHLLYGQTARITDRLNLLEHGIDNQLEKVTAARHDLKIPLSNIRNAAEISLICQPQLPAPVQENLTDIIEIAETSASQISALLARQDQRLELARVNLSEMVERVVDLVDLREYKVHLKLELDEAVLDPHLIEHVLLNLLSNARKFSAGGIGAGTRLAPVQWSIHDPHDYLDDPKPGDRAEAEIWVWNDGPVIGGNEREIIFRPGGQTALGRQAGGHGLGLTIVKSIVERHGGRIVVESHEKVGTTFRVFIPYIVLPAELQPEVEISADQTQPEVEHLTT